jgi:Uri superfamily endonuclease
LDSGKIRFGPCANMDIAGQGNANDNFLDLSLSLIHFYLIIPGALILPRPVPESSLLLSLRWPIAMDVQIPAKPGTYVLIFQNNASTYIQAGSLGRLVVEPGWYIYVGSAFGPGGLRGRLAHHLNDRPQRWHVDALKSAASIHSVWFTTDPRRLEHAWAQAWMDQPGITAPWKGFGSSDCRCWAHLFRSSDEPDLRLFEDRLQVLYPGLGHDGLLVQVFVHKIARF